MVGLPKALEGPLRAEKEVTALQKSVWSEGRGGADLLLEAPSGQETTVALSVFLLEQLVTALESAEATKPRRYSRASAIAAKLIPGAGGRDRIGSDDDEKKPKLHSLVLTRNREIAASLAQALVRLGKEIPNLAVATLVGGVPVAENNKTLKGGCHIAVGTPGRVKFLIQKGTLLPESGKTLVLESADWLIAPVFMEDVGYVVGKFPEEKQVVATSTVEASSIEEGLCALLGVPELHRIGTDGSVRKSGVRMPSCSPPPRAPTTGVPDRRLPSQGHVRAAGEALASRGPGAPMTLALTAKERLLEETRNALRISTARVVASSSGGGKARSPSSVTSDSRLTGTPKSFDRAPPPYSSVSSGMFSNCLSSKSNERVLSGAAWRRNSAGAKVGGNAGACGCDAGLLGALGAQDDDCASTLDLLSPGALHGSEGMRAGIVSGAVVNPATAAVANRGGRSSKPAGLARVPEHREQRHHDGQRDDGQHQPFVDSPAAGTASLEELDIPPVLLASLAAEGVTAPTPLQASVWTAGRGSRREDLLVHGRPGDETATAYSVPILECVLERCSPEATRRHGEVQLQALVLTRTRDMAANVSELLLRLGRGMQGLAVATLVGGVPVAENSRSLAGGCHVAVGTPGRVRFLMSKGLLRPWPAKTLVLDSADWLMAPIFQEDVGWIASRFAKERQILAFSGAEPSAIQESLGNLVGSPRLTSVGGESSVVAAATTVRTPLEQDEDMAAAAVATAEAEGGAVVTHDAGKIAYPADQQRSLGHGLGTTSSVVASLAAFEGASAAPGVVLTLCPATSTVPPMRTVGEMRAESARRAQMVGVDRGGSQQHPHQFHNAFGMMMSATTNATTAATVTATVSATAAARIKEAEGSYFSGGVNGSGGSGIYGSGSVSKGRKPSVPSTSSTASVSSAGSGVRARMRLSRENQLYGEWYGGVVHGRRRPPFGDDASSGWTRVS